MRISVVAPILSEAPWVGFSILAALPYVHEYVYALDEKSDDGTRELLHHVKDKYAHEKLVIMDHPTFHPSDMALYNGAFNRCIERSSGDAVWFLHPDMIVTDGPKDGIPSGAMAWWTQITSYAGDFQTVITKGRTDKWKNIHAKKMGLVYSGGYGSQNEDFYHTDITGRSFKHYGSEFSKYPFLVSNSGIKINHYCELKNYARRFEKMQLCLKTLYPDLRADRIEEMAAAHPRVTLEQSSSQFGDFEFAESKDPIPSVFEKYGEEFRSFVKEKELICHG